MSNQDSGKTVLVLPALPPGKTRAPFGTPSFRSRRTPCPIGEDAILELLQSRKASRRIEAVRQIRAHLRVNAGKLLYANKADVLEAIKRVFQIDKREDVSNACTQLVLEIVALPDDDLHCFRAQILQELLCELGSVTPAVRRCVLQTLHKFLHNRRSPDKLFLGVTRPEVENQDGSVRAATFAILAVLFSLESQNIDFYDLIAFLTIKLHVCAETDDPLLPYITLEHIRRHLGEETYNSYIERLPRSLRRLHKHFVQDHSVFISNRGLQGELQCPQPHQDVQPSPRRPKVLPKLVPENRRYHLPCVTGALVLYPATMKFGLIPHELHERLLDSKNYQSRTHGVDELKSIIYDLDIDPVPPENIIDFISFTRTLLEDSNFKVLCGTLEVLNLVIEKLGYSVETYLKNFVSAVAKVLGDTRAVTRNEYMKVYMQLMRIVGPQKVLDLLIVYLKHKNSRVREDVVNIITASILTHPRRDLDIKHLCISVSPCLADNKRKVRHAALELFALFAHSMGSGKTQPLVKAVDMVELNGNVEGLMAAVQARIARHSLPKLTPDGMVEYALTIPKPGQRRGPQFGSGADVEWLMAGGRIQSAQSHLSESDREPLWTEAEEISVNKRIISAGKGKNKLPWEKDSLPATGMSPTDTKSTPGVFNVDFQSTKLTTSSQIRDKDDLFVTGKAGEKSAKLDSSEPHQPRISGKKGLQEMSRKSGSVDSDLQLLEGSNSSRRERVPVHGSTTLSAKTARSLFGHHSVERTLSLPSNPATQGILILPSYPLASPTGGRQNSPPLHRTVDAAVHMSGARSVQWESSPQHTADEAVQKRLCPSTSRRGLVGARPVPPIPRGTNSLPRDHTMAGHPLTPLEKSAERNLQLDLSELTTKDKDHEEMAISLQSLRNSAAKKRAKLSGSDPDPDSPDSAVKLEPSLDSSSLTSPSVGSPLSESGLSSLQDSLCSPTNTFPSGNKSGSSINVATKPRLVRLSSAKLKAAGPLECSPNQGGLLQDRVTSDVSVVGQRLPYSNGTIETEEDKQRGAISPSARTLVREPPRAPKPPRGPPPSGTNGSSPVSGMSEGIVGRGVFGHSSPLSRQMSSPEHGDGLSKRSTELSVSMYPETVQHKDPNPPEDNEEPVGTKVKLSKSARDKMRMRHLEEQKHFSLQKEMKKMENSQQSLRMIIGEMSSEDPVYLTASPPDTPHSAGRSVNGNVRNSMVASRKVGHVASSPLSPTRFPAIPSPQPPRIKRATSLKKARSRLSHSSDELSAGSGAQKDGPEAPELRPFSKPDVALSQVFELLESDDWQKNIEGVTFVRTLSLYHTDVLVTRLHEVCLAVIKQVKNLRSGVSRMALVCLGDLFANLQRGMDQQLDEAVRVLLQKAAEANAFIRQDVDNALDSMVQNCNPIRALNALLSGGLSHLNSSVRKCMAQHLATLVEKMGSNRLLSGTKDVTDRFLPAVAKLSQDSSQETRYHARRMLHSVMFHEKFDRLIEKNLLANDLAHVQDTVNSLRSKGLGDMPLDASSARGRRSLPGSGTMRASSLTREPRSTSARETGEGTLKGTPRNLRNKTEYIKQLTGLLNSKDFRDRIKGIDQLVTDCQQHPDVIISNIFPVFDAFTARLQDSNSKVTLHALESLQTMATLLKDGLSEVVYIVVPALVENNLNSKNNSIYKAAADAVQALMQNLDNTLLLQPFCTKAKFLNGKVKVDLIECVADLVAELYPRKPQVVEQKVLPLLWHLLGSSTGSGTVLGRGGSSRTATAKLCQVLHDHMGERLAELGGNQPLHITKSLNEVLTNLPS
ncbi:TOG array regulator of axonemal microtubules protein 1 isoform X2 [Amia ocellicauda]|uniref:TOG array regulator of axonemal microtubules protein 1 isoform X2 n=1 Tax=Amia ocellicauda TaxID=2972642 RepID=UPI003463AA35